MGPDNNLNPDELEAIQRFQYIDTEPFDKQTLRIEPVSEEKEPLVIGFGNPEAEWTDIFPSENEHEDPGYNCSRLKKIESKVKSGFHPLSGIKLHFEDGTFSPWFETQYGSEGNDVETQSFEIDKARAVKRIAVKLSNGNAICGLALIDNEGDSIVEIEWENCEFGRYWKSGNVPDNYQIVGMKANTIDDNDIITRLAFVFKHFPEQ